MDEPKKRQFRSMYDNAVLVKTLTDGAHVIEHYRADGFRQYIWTRGKLRKDRAKGCCRCWKDMNKGEIAFRPITFKDERPDRLCQECMDDIIAGREREVENA